MPALSEFYCLNKLMEGLDKKSPHQWMGWVVGKAEGRSWRRAGKEKCGWYVK